ncbi:UDP-glycosyltransferase UGT5-like [Lycorma delicatula]|uniref:UDP-glycosyltransferase UGT5-like n=1 Tax=Lycorma delicatula TaxID=130591 RepID=UPI003F515BF5
MTIMKLVPLFGLCLLTLERTDASNILAVFPTPSLSHQFTAFGLAQSLVKNGHNVTILTPNPGIFEPLPNLHEIDLSIMYKVFLDSFKENSFSLQTTRSVFETMNAFSKFYSLATDALYGSEPVKNLLNSKETKFDLIIYEGLYPSLLGFVHHFKYPPSIAMVVIPFYAPLLHAMGNPINPAYVPSFLTKYNNKMSFFERLKNTFFISYEIYIREYRVYPSQDKVMEKYFGANLPKLKELEKNTSLLFLNGDLSQSYPIPLQPNTVLIGSQHMNIKKQNISTDVLQWMNSAEEGVIYFSLGSNMKGISVPEDKRNAFMKAFAQFPKFKVIWKWESDIEFPGKPANVLLKKWLPQHSILAHPKVRLFITQGGQQSRQEAIHYGIPTLTLPLFYDQTWNGKKTESSGAGLVLDFSDITYETFYEKLKLLLTDKSFKINMKKLSEISKDKPLNNEETVSWWVEYVIRHKGAPHLRPAVQDLSWYQYTLLDILAFILILLFSVIYVIYYIVSRFLGKSLNEVKIKLN